MSKQEGAGGSWGDLIGAAQALERELRRFEELTTAARKVPLDRQKTIERAAKATTEAAAGQQRVEAALGALVSAIKSMRDRHAVAAAALSARGEEIRLRAEALGGLLERWAALGEEGRAVNQLVQGAAARQRDATTPEAMRELHASIVDIEDRMTKLVEGARALGQAAAAASIADLAEQADALRQQVASARNKMGLLCNSLLVAPPDASKLN